jgi:hypothetical protein
MIDELNKTKDEIVKIAKEEGLFDWQILRMVGRYALNTQGVKMETWENLYEGLRQAVEEGEIDATSLQYFLNSPKTQRKIYAEKIKEGESIVDYVERVSRAYDSEKQMKSNMKRLINKYLYSEDSNMTEFNRTEEKAKRWEELDKDIKALKSEKDNEGAEKIKSSEEYKELSKSSDFYKRFLAVTDKNSKILKDNMDAYKKNPNENILKNIEIKTKKAKDEMKKAKDEMKKMKDKAPE